MSVSGCHGAFFFFAAVFRTTSLLVSVASLPRPVFSMVTHGQVMFVLLDLVAKFMFEERPHTALVPLLQTCTTFGVWHTVLMQSHLDNTLRAVHRLGGAWRVGSSRVLLHVRVGARARLAVRRGHRQNFDVRLMAAISYIPGALVDTMELPGTTYRPARTARAFPTARGHVQIEEMEARVKYLGGHYLYFCVSVITHLLRSGWVHAQDKIYIHLF